MRPLRMAVVVLCTALGSAAPAQDATQTDANKDNSSEAKKPKIMRRLSSLSAT